MTIEEALQIVIDECPNQYAVGYAKGYDEAVKWYGEEGRLAQLDYVLCNLNHWPNKEVKDRIRYEIRQG